MGLWDSFASGVSDFAGGAADFLGQATGFKAPKTPTIDPYDMDPAARDAALGMVNTGPRGVPGSAPLPVSSGFLSGLGTPATVGRPAGAQGFRTQEQGTKGTPGSGPGTYFGQRALYDQTRQQQLGANDLLRNAAMGNAPSVAELQLRQGQEAIARQAMGLAQSGRGNQTAAILAAQNAGVIGGQQLNQQQAALRAGEMAQSRGMYSQALAGLGGQDLSAAGQSANIAQTGDELALRAQMANQGAGLQFTGLGLQARGMDDARNVAGLGSLLDYETLAANNYFRPAEINAANQMAATQMQSQRQGGFLGGLSSIFAGGA